MIKESIYIDNIGNVITSGNDDSGRTTDALLTLIRPVYKEETESFLHQIIIDNDDLDDDMIDDVKFDLEQDFDLYFDYMFDGERADLRMKTDEPINWTALAVFMAHEDVANSLISNGARELVPELQEALDDNFVFRSNLLDNLLNLAQNAGPLVYTEAPCEKK